MLAAPVSHGQTSLPSNSSVVNQIDPLKLDNEFTIAQWNLIGPFQFSERDLSINNPQAIQGGILHDFLTDVGQSEENLTADKIATICADGKLCRVRTQHGAVLNFERLFPGIRDGVIYAAAQIEATADGSVGLEYDYNDGVKVWLNGHLLQESDNKDRHPVFKYFRFLPLHLQKGNNLLVLKVDQEHEGHTADRPWALIASLIPMNQMLDMWLEREDGALLPKRLVNAGESLHLPMLDDKVILDAKPPVHISIADWRGAVLLSRSADIDGSDEVKLPQLSEGYYTLTVQAGKHTIGDAFYVGNPDTIYNALCQLQHTTDPATQEYIQRDPIIQRYRILTSQQYSHPLDTEWQRKLLMALGDGVKSLHYSKSDVWYQEPGMHLREFKSKVDGTQQNYLLYLPQATHGPLPLVIIMPYAVTRQLPFLESALLTYFDYLVKLHHAADANGIAIAVINGRGTVRDAPIGEADAFEVLDDINNNYSIDKSRLYLYGNSEGGRRALLLAEHYPGVFASVGTYGALLTAYGGTYPNGHGDPSSLVNQLSSTPVILTQGESDDFLSIPTLKAFYESLTRAGSASKIEIVPDGMHDQDGTMEEDVFRLLATYKNTHEFMPIADLVNNARGKVHP
jgi:hypothetical protein